MKCVSSRPVLQWWFFAVTLIVVNSIIAREYHFRFMRNNIMLLDEWLLDLVPVLTHTKNNAVHDKQFESEIPIHNSNASKHFSILHVNATQAYSLSDNMTITDHVSLEIQPKDRIYRGDMTWNWDAAPIVVEKYNLIFFSVPKVACTTWKLAFRRMEGHKEWKLETPPPEEIPHNPQYNGLKYLSDYSIEEAQRMMTNPNYTKAIFVRDPKARVLSAFLDKGLGNNGRFVSSKCRTNSWSGSNRTFSNFLDLIQDCHDDHWRPQNDRMEAKYWPFINFVGHFENMQEDSQRLLPRIGAWEAHGETGWGKYGNLSIFEKSSNTNKHSTGADDKQLQWYTPELERRVESYYAGDYNNPLLDLTSAPFAY